MNAAQQLEYEARVRNRYALVAVIAGVLVLASSVTGLVGPQSRVSETTLALVFAHKRAALDIAGSVINLLGLLAEAATLNWLYRVSRARDETAKGIMRWLGVVGATVLGVALLFYTVLNIIKAGQFVTSGQQTYPQAHALTGGPLFAVPVLIADTGAFALTIGLCWISLVSMRIGLLPRFVGYVGVFAGVLIIFPFVQLPVVQVYWLLAVAALSAGRWPSGNPAAWSTGTAVPWPTAQTRGAAGAGRTAGSDAARGGQSQGRQPGRSPGREPQGARQPPTRRERLSTREAIMAAVKGGQGAQPAAPAAPEPLNAPEDSARTRANTPKRKRKHRK